VIIALVCVALVVGVVVAVRATAARFDVSDAQTAPAAGTGPPSAVLEKPSTGQAGLDLGWQQTDGDEFDGKKIDTSRWRVYDGFNTSSKETLSSKQCSLSAGVLTITGLANAAGTTCGLAWLSNRTFGRWELRARFSAPADHDFNPVFLLWPAADDDWQQTGEIGRVRPRAPVHRELAARAGQHRRRILQELAGRPDPVAQLRGGLADRPHHALHRRAAVGHLPQPAVHPAEADAPGDPAELQPQTRGRPAAVVGADRLGAPVPLSGDHHTAVRNSQAFNQVAPG
jgi:hypothetical protein